MIIDRPLPDRLQYKLDPIKVDAEVQEAKKTLLNKIERSVYIFRCDTGGCNGCDIEIFSTITPVFDAERFGIKNAASPRHADILVYDGPLTRAMRMPALRAYLGAPDPKIVMAFGACACTGGVFHDLYNTWGGIDAEIPIDVYIPGCPPTPYQTIHGFCVALGKLSQKLHRHDTVQEEGEQAELRYPNLPYKLTITMERKAREMAGYLYGAKLAKDFLSVLDGNPEDMGEALGEFIGAEPDERKKEIYRAMQAELKTMIVGHEQDDAFLKKSLLEIARNDQPLDDNPAMDILAKAFDLNGF